MVKLDNFGHNVNSDIQLESQSYGGKPDETAPYESSHQDIYCLLSKFIFLFK